MNSPAGSINIIPAKPDLTYASGQVQASYGNYNRMELRAMYNLPITESFALRASMMGLRRNGFITQDMDVRDLHRPWAGGRVAQDADLPAAGSAHRIDRGLRTN